GAGVCLRRTGGGLAHDRHRTGGRSGFGGGLEAGLGRGGVGGGGGGGARGGALPRHARNSRVRSSFSATVKAPVSSSTSSAKYGSQSLSSEGASVSVPLGTRRKRIRSTSKSQML